MFFSTISAFIVCLPLLAAASPVASPSAATEPSYCQSGTLSCCDESTQQTANSAGLLGLSLPLGSLFGSCSPITGLGIQGNQCSQQTVCCNQNSANGVIVFQCTPINVNL